MILTANAELMSFLLFLSFGLDGFAHAAEALGGRAIDACDHAALIRTVNSLAIGLLAFCFLWGGVFISWMGFLSQPHAANTMPNTTII